MKGGNSSDSPIAPMGIEYFGIEEQIAMAKALSLSEQETRQNCNTKESKSASYKRTDSGDGNSNNKQRSKCQNGYPSASSSSASQQKANNYANITANMKPTLAEFVDDFDGEKKMPAKKKNNKKKSGQQDDFGDRGPSWELEWNCSSPKMHNDSGFC